ncbi:hypothetical protein FB451DRAFT_1447900 [Mycena latifolia]|nr:hypothetical protein FB451DRAFT_1447900 [Mycena latifolia]
MDFPVSVVAPTQLGGALPEQHPFVWCVRFLLFVRKLTCAVANCLWLAAATASCSSEVAVNCFCVALPAKTYAPALVACLTAFLRRRYEIQLSLLPHLRLRLFRSVQFERGVKQRDGPASSSAPPLTTPRDTAGAARPLALGVPMAMGMSVAGVLGAVALRTPCRTPAGHCARTNVSHARTLSPVSISTLYAVQSTPRRALCLASARQRCYSTLRILLLSKILLPAVADTHTHTSTLEPHL